MPPADVRRVVGAMVCAKPCHVTSFAECRRRFGANAKTVSLQGTVTQVTNVPTSTGRSSSIVHASYELGDGVFKTAPLNVRSVGLPPEQGPNTRPAEYRMPSDSPKKLHQSNLLHQNHQCRHSMCLQHRRMCLQFLLPFIMVENGLKMQSLPGWT